MARGAGPGGLVAGEAPHLQCAAVRGDDALLATVGADFGDVVDGADLVATAAAAAAESLERGQLGRVARLLVGAAHAERGAEGAGEGADPALHEGEEHGEVGGDDGYERFADGP